MTFTEGLQFHKYNEDDLRELNKVLAKHPQLSVFRRDVNSEICWHIGKRAAAHQYRELPGEVLDREQFERELQAQHNRSAYEPVFS